ncbi:MAG: EAL domain-containing protein [Desulfuromonadales bacterium]|nr:EAL domain-containing protein [Desulfuromonadales bacterium]
MKPSNLEHCQQTAIGGLLEIALSVKPLKEKLASALALILDASPDDFRNQGSIFLTDGQSSGLVLAAECNLAPSLRHECTNVPLGHCVCGQAAQQRRTVFLCHDSGGGRHPHGHFCAPIIAGEQLLGVLNVYTSPRPRLTDHEEAFLASATQSLALMIARHRSDDELLAQRDLLRKILDHLPLRVFWKDRNSVFLGGNQCFARDAGVNSPQELVGRRDEDLAGRRDDAATYLRRDHWVLQEGQPLADYEELRRTANGQEAMVVASLLPLHDGKGEVSGVLGMYADVTGQRETESRLRSLTINDQLTGLPNLTLIKDRLEQAIISARYGHRTLGLVYLDLDNFQKVNNSFGHAVGDEVLRLAGERLRQLMFSTDTVGRMGGDVFVLLLRDLRIEDDITLILRKLRQALEPPFIVAGHEVFVTASMGGALYPHDGADAASLLQNANTALHKAKEHGRNGCQLYSPEMNTSALMRLSLESQLRKALDLQQFEVFYQPQVDARNGRLVGAEALVRWRHPELGLVAPGDFIPLAEETGLIIDIGAWVLNEACVRLKGWHEQGLSLERLAVNLSPLQFQDHDLVTTVCSALLDSGLDPALLELEITESAVMHDADKAADILRYFREMGVRVAIDDFGTGYSSLSLLKKFPITLLKIDRAFTHGIEQGEDDKAIVTAIIAMGHQLGLKVLAEGVETEAEWAFLRESGCDELQGYLFSRPLELVAFEELLAKESAIADLKKISASATLKKTA